MRNNCCKPLALLVAAFTATGVRAAPSNEAEVYFNQTVTLIQQRHVNSVGADWPAIRAKAQMQIADARTTASTYSALRSILLALGEKHSFLVEPRVAPPAGDAKTTKLRGTTPLPRWRVVEGKFGYVMLPALNTMGEGREAPGPIYTETLKAGLATMDHHKLCGWVVDLRDNGGGNMWPMLQGLDPLLGEGPFGYFILPGGAQIPWIRTATGLAPSNEPNVGVRRSFTIVQQNAPVAVLIGPATASSGEMTALALIGRPGVRTFGAPSAGLTTAN